MKYARSFTLRGAVVAPDLIGPIRVHASPVPVFICDFFVAPTGVVGVDPEDLFKTEGDFVP